MEEIFIAYRSRIYGFLYPYIKVKSQVEDVTQEVMMKLWMNRDKLENVQNLDNYILTMAYHAVMDHFKKMNRDQNFKAEIWKTIESSKNDVMRNILQKDLVENVEKVLSKLPTQQQRVYRMNKFEGMSLDEIGSQLNISPYTAKNHLAQAIKQLRGRINPEYFLLLLIFFK